MRFAKPSRPLGLALPGLMLATCLFACRQQNETYQAPARVVPKTVIPASFQVDDQTRFFGNNPPGGASQSPLAWKTPPGWTQVASTDLRDPNFTLDGVQGGEAYVSILSGGGGGVEANINRWRKQFGKEPIAAAELSALPTLPIMGRPAAMLDETGTFAGMGDGASQENWRLVGAILNLPAVTITIKMTGPAAALDAQLDNFKAFAASLTMAMPGASGGSATSGAVPAPGMAALPNGSAIPAEIAQSASTEAPFVWTAPAGWQEGAPRTMRLATYGIPDSPKTDIYLSMLGGTGGGKEMNIGRWYKQVGLPAPSAEAIAALPTIKVMGIDSTLVEATGHFTGMGDADIPDGTLIGVICQMPDEALFIKMTGPAETVKAQRDAFIKFCEGIKPK